MTNWRGQIVIWFIKIIFSRAWYHIKNSHQYNQFTASACKFDYCLPPFRGHDFYLVCWCFFRNFHSILVKKRKNTQIQSAAPSFLIFSLMTSFMNAPWIFNKFLRQTFLNFWFLLKNSQNNKKNCTYSLTLSGTFRFFWPKISFNSSILEM